MNIKKLFFSTSCFIRKPVIIYKQNHLCLSARKHTCWGRVLRLEQPHYTLAMKASWAEQNGFGARVFPAHNRQTVVSEATGYFV